MEVLWFIPAMGDGRYLGTSIGKRPTTPAYMRQIAEAIDGLGFAGALIPTGQGCEDSWILASSLIHVTQRMKFLIAVRPGLMSPTVAARMTATFDRMSNGRLLINVVAGGDPVELAGDGLHVPHDERYQLTDEFMTVWSQMLAGEEVNFQGPHVDIRKGKLILEGVQKPHPPVYFGGSSAAGHAVAAKHADVYLTLGEPPHLVAEKIADIRKRAAEIGRTMRIGVRLHVYVRETEEEAWAAAENILKYVDEATIAAAQAKLARFDSVGQSRMRNLHGGDRAALEISPNLWAGIGLVNSGVGTALVGDPETVTARLMEYAALGVDTFILSSYPHLEEAYRVAELVLPRLPLDQNQNTAAQSGIIAKDNRAMQNIP